MSTKVAAGGPEAGVSATNRYSSEAHGRARGVVYPSVSVKDGQVWVVTPDGGVLMRFSIKNSRAFADDLNAAATELEALSPSASANAKERK